MRTKFLVLAAITFGGVLGWLTASGQFMLAQTPTTSPASSDSTVLPRPDQLFKGKIGRTAADSTPDFPKAIEAPNGAPNILLIMTDDVG